MSYQVLARKWRPRNFSTLVGQEHVVRALTHALTEKRLHHAYLFTGTRGVGKTTIARILAKSLNCESGITATPCGQCSACQEIDAGRFVDLLEVDAATNTRVDEMRQLLENAVYAPTRGRFKVYVIDEVHMLSTSAFNAMLKTLEEPPEHVKFILATTDPQKIPVTVLSRCLQFNLKQMPAPAISSHLATILQAEGIPYDIPALSLIARSAAGSMRDSLSLLDQAIAHGAGRVDEPQVRAMLGSLDQDHLYEILEALLEGNAAALLGVAAALSVRSLSFGAALQDLAALLVRMQIVQSAPAAVDDEDPEKSRLLALAAAFHPEFIQLAYQIVTVGRQELPLAPDEYAGFVMTLLRLHAFRPQKVGELVQLARIGSLKAVSAPLANAPPVSSGEEVAKVAAVSLPKEGLRHEDWSSLIDRLSVSGLARELATNCELLKLDEGACLLRLAPGKAHLQMKPALDKLHQALGEYLGRQVQLKIEVGEVSGDTPAQITGRQKQAIQADAEAAILNDEFVREAQDILGASILDSSIKPIA
ncbi:MAG: DNA polymerase III subunit gamma/tau [Azonexaceae bacterium]|nr:DNA polymerase III subunit gamma/tau [Azonexaceae bacterium]